MSDFPSHPDPSGNRTLPRHRQRGILRELAHFLWLNRLWWMIPVVAVLALLFLFAALALSAGSAAPFIYTLF